MEIERSFVFDANWNAKEKIIINQGGTSSGKTYSILQVLFFKAIYEPGSIITVCGQDIPNLKKGAYRDAQNIYASTPEFQYYIREINKSERIIYFINGSIIEFNSYDGDQDARSGKRDYLFINEANGVMYMIFWQLFLRTRKQTFIDFNPSVRFWCHDNLIGQPDTKLIISDHHCNPFLTDEQHFQIENIKDKELWNVYARGRTGNLIGTIFPDWTQIADEDFPKDAPFVGGLDFGYTNDPTVLIKACRVGDSIFFHECFYETGIAPQQMHAVARANGFKDHVIHADHDPDGVVPLRRLGLYVLPARKGPGSIKAGIAFLKRFKVFYTASSKNLALEKKNYQWEKAKDDGTLTNQPIDKYNHALDACRYAAYSAWCND